MARRFEKLLQELEYVPDDEVAYVTSEPTGAHARLQKSIMRGEFARMSDDIREKGEKARARLPGVLARSRALDKSMATMLKAIRTTQAEVAETFAKSNAISEHKAASARFEAWNRRFGEAVKAGTMNSHEAATLEAHSHQRAAALVEQSRRLGVK